MPGHSPLRSLRVRIECKCLDPDCDWSYFEMYKAVANKQGKRKGTAASIHTITHVRKTGHEVEMNRKVIYSLENERRANILRDTMRKRADD